MLMLLLILVSTVATTTVGVPNARVSDSAPEMLHAVIGAHHLSRRSARSRVVPEAMQALYAARREHKTDVKAHLKPTSRGAATVRSFTHKDRDITTSHLSDTETLLWFNITDIPATEKLRASELHLHRDPFHDGGPHSVHIHVHDVIHRSPLVTRLVDTHLVSTKSSDKISLDVQPAVERWLHDPESNHGLLVELASSNTTVATSHVRVRRGTTEDAFWLQHQPVLLAFLDDAEPRSARTRRRVHPRRKNTKRNCRRHRMYVDFAEVGWDDWIVAPSGYEAYYCLGDCSFPIADHLNATNHAIVQTLQNSADPRVVPKPCCVPTELGPISMLYTDSDDKTVLKVYQDMVVIGCGCR